MNNEKCVFFPSVRYESSFLILGIQDILNSITFNFFLLQIIAIEVTIEVRNILTFQLAVKNSVIIFSNDIESFTTTCLRWQLMTFYIQYVHANNDETFQKYRVIISIESLLSSN